MVRTITEMSGPAAPSAASAGGEGSGARAAAATGAVRAVSHQRLALAPAPVEAAHVVLLEPRFPQPLRLDGQELERAPRRLDEALAEARAQGRRPAGEAEERRELGWSWAKSTAA